MIVGEYFHLEDRVEEQVVGVGVEGGVGDLFPHG